MNLQEFKASLADEYFPEGVSELVEALWYAGKNDWHAAHEIAQSREGTKEYDLLHAYLHRVEGDEWNANYWYRRAGSKMPKISLDEEWELLATRWL